MKQHISIGLLIELLDNKIIKAKDLAAKFEVSTRTIYRYLDSLESAGIPTVTYVGKNGGLSISKNFKLKKSIFSDSEKMLLKSLLMQSDNMLILSILNKLDKD